MIGYGYSKQSGTATKWDRVSSEWSYFGDHLEELTRHLVSFPSREAAPFPA